MFELQIDNRYAAVLEVVEKGVAKRHRWKMLDDRLGDEHIGMQRCEVRGREQ